MCWNVNHLRVDLPTHSTVNLLTQLTMQKLTFYRLT